MTTNRDVTTILVSGYFSGPGAHAKLAYLERLDYVLQRHGYRLFLMNLTPQHLSTPCAHYSLPHFIHYNHLLHNAGRLEAAALGEPFSEAVRLEAGESGVPPENAARKIAHFLAVARRIVLRETPALAVLWHQFNPLHYALAALCRDAEIPVLFAEYGVLPGTVAFDAEGQMAESWVARDNERFVSLPVTAEQRATATRYLQAMREQRRSRKPQPAQTETVERLRTIREDGRPVIFYAGENPYRTGMLPADTERARLHSPHFRSTAEALEAVCSVAETRGWHVVFKPHPLAKAAPSPSCQADTLTVMNDANVFDCILESDVTATLVSQVSYLALIHGKPCVLMGRNPLSGKGCAYELPSPDALESTLQEALAEGFMPAQQEAWRTHAAQLCAHYLFALEPDVEALIGRGVREAADEVVSHANPEASARRITTVPDALAGAGLLARGIYDGLLLSAPVARTVAALLPRRAKRRLGEDG